jgi:MFS family permease
MNSHKASKIPYSSIIVAACFLIQGFGVGSFIAYGVFFKPLLAEFGWSRATISGASSMAFLLMGLLGIVAGNLNDRFGPRIIMAVTGVLFGSGYLLLSKVHSVWQLYLFYGLVGGMGLSSVDVIALTTIARWFVRRRGTMTGIVKVGTGAGQLVMPLLASIVIIDYGWRSASVFVGIVVLVFVIGSGLLLRRDPGQMGQLPDGGREPPKDQMVSSETGLSLQEALRRGTFWMVCLVGLLAGSCLLTIMVHIVPHAIDIGMEPIKAAGVLSTIGGVSMLGRLSTGLAIDRIGNKKSLIICFMLLILSFLWLRVSEDMWMLYLFAVIYGVAHGAFFTVISPIVARLFGISSHGVLFGIVAFSVTVGGAAGPVLAGLVFDITTSYQLVFLILTGVSIASLLLSLSLKPVITNRGRA